MELMERMKRQFAIAVLLWALPGAVESIAAQNKVELARDGQAQLSVVVGDNASGRVRNAAADLASYLGRMCGSEFRTRIGDGRMGIAVGVASDFPLLDLVRTLEVREVADREAYVLKSHAQGLHVIGATELAVEHAVWDLLHRLSICKLYHDEPEPFLQFRP